MMMTDSKCGEYTFMTQAFHLDSNTQAEFRPHIHMCVIKTELKAMHSTEQDEAQRNRKRIVYPMGAD